jgi:hypothetical protein
MRCCRHHFRRRRCPATGVDVVVLAIGLQSRFVVAGQQRAELVVVLGRLWSTNSVIATTNTTSVSSSAAAPDGACPCAVPVHASTSPWIIFDTGAGAVEVAVSSSHILGASSLVLVLFTHYHSAQFPTGRATYAVRAPPPAHTCRRQHRSYPHPQSCCGSATAVVHKGAQHDQCTR